MQGGAGAQLAALPSPNRTRGRVHLLVASVAVSALGTWSYNVGIAVYAYEKSGSTAWVAAATVGRYLPALLLTWLGSRWAARFAAPAVAVVCDLVCAVTMVVLTVLAAYEGPLLLLVGAAALSSGLARIQNAAALACAADLATESRVVPTTVLLSTVEAVATAAGPALAAVVLTLWSPVPLFALNAVTFTASAVLLALAARTLPWVRRRRRTERRPVPPEAYRQVVRSVWPLLVTRMLAAFLYGADVVLLAVLATDRWAQGTAGYGWLLAAAGSGALVAATALRGRDVSARPLVFATGGLLLYALPLLGFLPATGTGVDLVVQAVRGAGLVVATATVIATLLRRLPAGQTLRALGLANSLALVGTSLGAVVAALLVQVAGLDVVLVVVSLLPVAVQLAMTPALARLQRTGNDSLATLDPAVSLMRSLSLFQDASRSTLIDLAEHAETVVEEAGAVVIEQGDPAEHLYVLVEGSVDVLQASPSGPVRLRRLEAPGFFGEIGLLHAIPRTATVRAAERCTLWRVEGDVFLSAARESGISSALAGTVAYRIAGVPDRFPAGR